MEMTIEQAMELAKLLGGKDDAQPEQFLTPEQLALHATPFDDQAAMLQQQMEMAKALRGQGQKFHTPAGALFGGIGDMVREYRAGKSEAEAREEQKKLLEQKRQDTLNFINAFNQAQKMRGAPTMAEAEQNAASSADMNALAAPANPMPLPQDMGDLDLFNFGKPYRYG